MRRLFQCFVCVSLVLAVGGHWAFLQSVAWVGMAIDYSQDAPLLEALQKTFSGDHPCKLCKVVDQGKKEERKQAAFKVETKLEFLSLPSCLTVFAPVVEEATAPEFLSFFFRANPPPVPPPRPVSLPHA